MHFVEIPSFIDWPSYVRPQKKISFFLKKYSRFILFILEECTIKTEIIMYSLLPISSL